MTGVSLGFYPLENNMKERVSLINLAQKIIYKLYPNVISMDINVIKLASNIYISKIILKTSKKNFFVTKEAQGYKESLDRSCHALKKQLERGKIDRVHKSRKKMVFEDEVGGLHYTELGQES